MVHVLPSSTTVALPEAHSSCSRNPTWSYAAWSEVLLHVSRVGVHVDASIIIPIVLSYSTGGGKGMHLKRQYSFILNIT
jgi:hypothetical protein